MAAASTHSTPSSISLQGVPGPLKQPQGHLPTALDPSDPQAKHRVDMVCALTWELVPPTQPEAEEETAEQPCMWPQSWGSAGWALGWVPPESHALELSFTASLPRA